MKSTHRIELTAEDVRAAVAEYLATKGGDCPPSDATIRCTTQRPFRGAAVDKKAERETIALVVEWGTA